MAVYTERKVKRQGKKDGRNWKWKFFPFEKEPKSPIPPDDQTEYADYEILLKEAAENDMQKIATAWEAKDEKLKINFCKAKNELESAEKELPKEKQEELIAYNEYKKAQDELLNLSAPTLSPFWMYFWLFVIGIGEFFLNSVVFQIFGQRMFETYLMALGLAVAIPILGHEFGKLLKQEKKRYKEYWIIVLIPIITLVVLFGLAILRAKFFEVAGIQEVLGLKISPTTGTLIFLFINIFLFFISAILSYAGSYPEHEEYKRRKKRYKYAWKNYKKESADVGKVQHRLVKAQKHYIKAKQKRKKVFEYFKGLLKEKKENYEHFVAVYRYQNISQRGKRPPCFNNPILPVQFPESLQNLDETC